MALARQVPAGAVTAPRPGTRRRRRGPGSPRWWVIVAFLSPFVVGFCVFNAYPILAGLYYSFTNLHVGSYRPVQWVGLANYRNLVTTDDQFFTAVRNTLWMVVVLVPLQTIWAIFTAWVLTRLKRGSSVYRTIFFLPAMVPLVASALSFVVVLHPTGVVNRMLGAVGVTGPGWFGDPTWAKPSLVLMGMWGIGNIMILFLAGMLDVPRSLYESAALDGAGAVRQFRHITLPGISPVIFFAVLTSMISIFQYFTEAYVASSAGSETSSANALIGYPQNSLLFYSSKIYQEGFSYFKTGYASAMAWLLFLVIFICSIVFIKGSRRWVHYSGTD